MAAIPARTLTLSLTMAALGTVMMIVGMFVIFEWPHRLGISAGRGLFFGLLFCAPAQFLYAAAAEFLFPDADPRLTGAFELAPWIVLALALVGGLIWFPA